LYLQGAPLSTSYIVSPSKNIRPLKRHGAIGGAKVVVGSGGVGVGGVGVGSDLHVKSLTVTCLMVW